MVDHDYKSGDNFMLNNNLDFKLYKRPFEIMQCWNKGTVALQWGVKKFR